MRALALAVLLAAAARAGDWPGFRGPAGDGSAVEANLPVTRSVKWRTALPGPGAGTPAVVGDRIYLTAVDRSTTELIAMGLERASGKVLWRVNAGAYPAHGGENAGASCSPTARGDRAYFAFGNGVVLCTDSAGREIWRRQVGPFQIIFGYASSPLLVDDTLYVQVVHRGPSSLIALDATTGKTRWSHARASDALAESQEAYTTPVPATLDGQLRVLVLGGDRLTAHDPATGAVTWQWGGYNPDKRENFRVVPAPLVHGQRVFVNAPQGSPLHALALGASTAAWTLDEPVTDVPTPAWGDGVVVLSDKQRRLARVDPETGKPVWNTRLADLRVLRASPLVADGKVYVIDTEGELRIVSLADGRVVGQMSMGEPPCQAGPVAAGGRLYVRTGEALYCIAK